MHHKVLHNKLQSISVQGSKLNWFESYLSNRQQVTKIGDFMSSQVSSFKFILLQNALWPNGQITHNLH